VRDLTVPTGGVSIAPMNLEYYHYHRGKTIQDLRAPFRNSILSLDTLNYSTICDKKGEREKERKEERERERERKRERKREREREREREIKKKGERKK
jgi:hypothetical protein